MKFIPEVTMESRIPERAYFWNILNTVHPQYVKNVIEHANNLRMKANDETKLSLFETHFEKSYRTEERIDAKNKTIEDLKGKIEAKDKKIAELEARLQKAVVGGEWNLQTVTNSRTKSSQEVPA